MTAIATAEPSRQPADQTPAVRARDRVLGISGIAFAAVLLPVVLVPHASLDLGPTKPAKDPLVVTSFFREHYALQQYQAFMHSMAAVVLLVFFAALAGQVRRSDRDARLAARLTLAGGTGIAVIMVLTMALVSGSISLTGGVDGATQGWMYTLGWWEHFKCVYLLPVAMGPACLTLRRHRVLPAALAWTGLSLSALGPVAMAGALDASTEFWMFPVFLLLMLWMLATGIVAVTRGMATPSARASRPPTSPGAADPRPGRPPRGTTR